MVAAQLAHVGTADGTQLIARLKKQGSRGCDVVFPDTATANFVGIAGEPSCREASGSGASALYYLLMESVGLFIGSPGDEWLVRPWYDLEAWRLTAKVQVYSWAGSQQPPPPIEIIAGPARPWGLSSNCGLDLEALGWLQRLSVSPAQLGKRPTSAPNHSPARSLTRLFCDNRPAIGL